MRHPVLVLAILWLMCGTAWAGGPRWITGAPYFSQNVTGNAVVWGTTSLRYSTDPGDLSVFVNHAAADALVATAASSWNVSVSAMVVSQGGVLGEDVNGSNVYMGASGPVFPADVSAGNAGAIPVAVIYDADGAVTDMLLGGGASDPGNCRQTAVTESVDGISTAGKITHALLILNGRCTGPAPEMQKEMTYRLVRAFGRILGVGWSQLNDNVFTGSPQPTAAQAMHWPVMHPIDVLCGPYAYQCLPQPYVLRPDDIATMVGLYPESGADAGKTNSFTSAAPITGTVTFPNGAGMEGVNLVEHRFNISQLYMDTFEETSAVTGYRFQRQGPSVVAAKGTSADASLGYLYYPYEGRYDFPWIPLEVTWYENVYITVEAINPLYVGQYAVGPYGALAQVTPSGSLVDYMTTIGANNRPQTVNFSVPNGVATCTASGDGTEAAPVSVASSGMWTGVLCAFGHTAWGKMAVKAGRTLTVEMTALDEQGLATGGKAQPVFGVWASTDKTGTLPTVARASTPLNTSTLGMTALTVSNAAARTLRMGFGDARGDGRQDYGYKVRVLYAESVSPESLPASGGVITITGMGFRNGNAVTVNGVAATVTSWSANTIVAVAPAMPGPVAAADVTVTDVSTMGTTTITGGIAYTGTVLPNVVSVVSVPADGSMLGVAASVPFGVKVVLADGLSPAAGVGVVVSATNGAGLVGCGGAAGCTLTTDAAGMVRTVVVPSLSGTVSLGATVGTVTASGSFVAGGRAADVLRVTSLPSRLVYAGIPAGLPWIVQVMLGDGVTPDAGAQISVSAVGAGLGGCGGLANCVLTADGLGLVATTVVPGAAGVVSLQAKAGGGTVSASFGAVAMPADTLRVVSAPANGAVVGVVAATGFQVRVMLGDGVTPAAGAAVTVTAAGGTLAACGLAVCVLTADGLGVVSTGVAPGAAGLVTLTATAGGGRVQTSFTAVAPAPDRLEVMSVPASGGLVGVTAPGAFSVRLLLGDAVTPVVGAVVTLTVTGGMLGVCGASTCVVKTDATGTVTTTVAASVAGTVGLVASVAGLSVSTSFGAVADSIRLVAVPPGPSYVGVATKTPVTMQVIGPDGVTPAAGASVTMTTSLGTLVACGLPTCVMTADGQGMVSTTVLPVAVGVVSIQAWSGGGMLGTAFSVQPMPPGLLKVVSIPSGTVYVGMVAAAAYTLQALKGDGETPDVGATVFLSTPQATLSPGCSIVCLKTSDANGRISLAVTPLVSGTIRILASGPGMTLTSTFVATAMPPDVLTVVSSPANGAEVGKVAGTPLAVRVMLGDRVTPAANAAVVVTATRATLGVCGRATCPMTTDATGLVSTTVTPVAAGTVSLVATAGGVSATAAFTAVVLPDVLTVASVPANGALLGSVAGTPFAVKVMLADGVTAAVGASVTMTATGATLGCGTATCVLTVGASGVVSTGVTPTVAGMVGLAATAGGGTASASFSAVAPADVLTVVSAPGNGALLGSAATVPFAVKTVFWNGAPASGVAVTLTASGGTLGCGLSTCVLTADALGVVSTTVTPTAAGTIRLAASGGGGSVAASFVAVMPPDVLTVVSVPANGALLGSAAAVPFVVKAELWNGAPAAGVAVTVAASGGILGCGLSTCVLTADALGLVSATVTPAVAGTVGLAASAGGGSATASFTAATPPNVLTVVSAPANGASVGSVAGAPFAVKTVLWNGVPASGATVSLTAAGASLGCGASTCVLTADALGVVSTSVTPMTGGTVVLAASAGGGTAGASFTAVIPPNVLTVVSAPANGTLLGAVAAAPFAVKTVLWNGVPASGATVSLTATGASLGCGASTCVLTADALGVVSTSVTPMTGGTVVLAASAGGGTAGASFTAVIPPDVLTVVSAPANGALVGSVAAAPFAVKTMLWNGVPASGATVSLTAAGVTLGCGASTCMLTADASGVVSTSVTPMTGGTVVLAASAGGGTAGASFTAIIPVDTLTVVSAPANGAVVGSAATVPFVVKTVVWNGAPAAGAAVTLAAVGGTLGACGAAACVVTADADGLVSTPVTPTGLVTVRLTATAGGGTATASFAATVLPPDVLTVKAVPASGGYVGRVAGGVFQVAVVMWDGTPAAGAAVTLTATNGTLSACGAASCVLTVDASGTVSTAVAPVAAGLVGLTAVGGGGSVSASFTSMAMPPDVVTVVSVPRSGGYVGAAVGLFAVKMMLGDGTVGAGVPVTLTAVGGVLGCGATSCVSTADALGMVSTTVTPSVVGLVGLAAAAGGVSVSGSFMTVAAPVDVLTVMSLPGNGAYVGDVASTPLRVKVWMGDGVTVGAGVAVTLTATGGVLGCGVGSCVMTADSAGMVSTTVTPSVAGAVAVRAAAGGGVAVASFTAVDHVRAVTMVQAVEYVAAGAVVNWASQAVVTLDGAPVSVAVSWTGGPGMVVQASGAAVIGPLGSGGTASGSACAWVSVCAGFSAVVVDQAVWGIVAVSGGGQTAAVGGAFDPVVARVMDRAGHPVAGVPVTVRQVVNGYVACPVVGRCPVGPVLGASSAMAVSGGNGLVSVAALVVGGVGETTGMVLTAGENGFLSTSLSMVP